MSTEILSLARRIPRLGSLGLSQHTTKSVYLEQRRWIGRNYIRNIQEAEKDWGERREAIEAGRKQSVLSLLEERGYVNQIVGTRDDLNRLLNERRTGAYVGVDPTAPSLHVGHMIPFMALSWLYIHGYSVHYLLGGATARIGDPTDRLKARDDVARTTRKANMASMHMQLKRFGYTMEAYADRRGYKREWAWRRSLVNNVTWYTKTTLMEFLSSMALGTRVGPMLGRDTVKNRLAKGDGMSLAEFCYPLVQAWDWWELYKKGVQIQIGGGDQFGNILAGAEAVKWMSKNDQQWLTDIGGAERVATPEERKRQVPNDPMGFTVPLLTTASGEKFGKSAGNAVWLDQDMTSPFDLYQFFLRSADADVEKYLKLLTFMPLPEITSIMQQHQQDESKRVAQHRLAREFVELIHGLGAAEEAESSHRQLFSKALNLSDIKQSLSTPSPIPTSNPNPTITSPFPGRAADVNPSLNKHAPPATLESNASNNMLLPSSLIRWQPLSKVAYVAGLVASRSEAQRLINAKGLYIGAQKGFHATMQDNLSFLPATESKWEYWSKYIVDDSFFVLRVGKWKVKVISIVSDEEFRRRGLSCPEWEFVQVPGKERSEEVVADEAQAEELEREKNVRERERGLEKEKRDRRVENAVGRVVGVKSPKDDTVRI